MSRSIDLATLLFGSILVGIAFFFSPFIPFFLNEPWILYFLGGWLIVIALYRLSKFKKGSEY